MYPDPKSVNMAKAFDRARVRCVLPERSVSSRVIIIGGEFHQNSPQMLFVDHDQMIGTLTPDRPDQAFNTSVLPGCAERGGPIPDAHRSDAGLKYAAECLVIIANEIFWRLVSRKRLGDLPRQPLGRLMRRNGRPNEPAAAMAKHQEPE